MKKHFCSFTNNKYILNKSVNNKEAVIMMQNSKFKFMINFNNPPQHLFHYSISLKKTKIPRLQFSSYIIYNGCIIVGPSNHKLYIDVYINLSIGFHLLNFFGKDRNCQSSLKMHVAIAANNIFPDHKKMPKPTTQTFPHQHSAFFILGFFINVIKDLKSQYQYDEQLEDDVGENDAEIVNIDYRNE